MECVEVHGDEVASSGGAVTLASGFTSEQQEILYRRAMRAWRPPAKMTVSEWAEKHYVHEKGKLRLIPFQRGILDAFSDPQVERISFKKSARVGATMSMVICCIYFAAQDPMNLMLVQPTDDDCRGISTDHIGPAYDRTPQTQKLFSSSKATRNTLTHKVFPGGSLKILAAKSPRNLRRHDVDVLMLDECDGYETTVEGDPVELAIRRTQNSARRKIFMASTPVNAQTSKIAKAFNDSDQRYYFMPCPHCGVSMTYELKDFCVNGIPVTKLQYRDIDITADNVAHFRCPECGEDIHEDSKKWMLENGEWIATKPFNGHAGFAISTFLSPFPNASWQKLYLEYLRAKRSPDTLQTFWNTVLGLEWSDNLDDLDENEVFNRRTEFSLDLVPGDCLLLTAGIDVQKDRVEVTILGWSETRTWVLSHEKLYGDPTGVKLWEDLDAYLEKTYQHELGGKIGIAAAAVDSGNWTEAVYRYTADKQLRGIYSIKGQAGKVPIWRESKIRPGGGAKLYNVGVDTAKTVLMQRLTVQDRNSDGYIEFSDKLDFEYFEQLLSEYRKVEYVAGRPKFVWERKQGRRAEALDCFVYALAARHTLSPNWQRLADDLVPQELGKAGSAADDAGFGELGAAFNDS